MKNFNENGRSMVEMLGVLAIIGVLSVGGIAGYSKAMNKYKINKTTDQVSMLVANIRTLFSSQGNYDGLTNQQAKKFGVVPNDMYTKVSSDDIKNAFGGDVTIAEAGGRAAGDGEAFLITYDGLSSEACVTLATGDWGSGQASGLIAIAAGGKSDGATAGTSGVEGVNLGVEETGTNCGGTTACTVAVAVPGGSQEKTPMSVTSAVNACSCTSTACEVTWKYY